MNPKLILAALLGGAHCLMAAGEVNLLDGKSLSGWEVAPGEEKWWKIEDGMIVGGSLTEAIPHNTFLSSTTSYSDFELKFKLRLIPGEGFINSGMQIRSQRAANGSGMIGYQVDAGEGHWGDLYDEERRNVALVKSTILAAKDTDWNEYRIVCQGPRIQTWINGIQTCDYTEADTSIPSSGKLGLQVHSGGKLLVQAKDITLTELSLPNQPRTPELQQAAFRLPPGFTAELVASEEQGVNKPITIAWDRHGRMWTMTATEYPVDANENDAAARELFKNGGKDRLLVIDEPNRPGPHQPTTFTEKLAIPLGILPLADGTLVQHGQEIRRYIDKDGNGKADRHEVILEGFGIQDSHLFPHQFEVAPGGWIYLAQGAFNYSLVSRPGGGKFANGSDSIEFNNCKLARFRPDGSEFDPLTGGPNNIWGLTSSRTGEVFIQEANDLGYPVAEFAPGIQYPTFAGPKIRNDAPFLPQSTPASPMGGTGLSGLAISQDTGSPFTPVDAEGATIFYIANPITSRVQIVKMTRDEKGHPIYQKQPDFMLSDDPWFRPIAIRFGPDGCLYVVDWYNKIISHNEVPRVHPDRDKHRGRIWRIRHESQSKEVPQIDFSKLATSELTKFLGHANAHTANQTWQEIAGRKDTALIAPLREIILDERQSLGKRCSALWAIELLPDFSADILLKLSQSPHPELRHEAIRIAGEKSLEEAAFLAVADALKDEKHFRVRAAIGNAVRQHKAPTPQILLVAAQLGLPALDSGDRIAYDRDFERYLAKWAMSDHPEATRSILKQEDLTTEMRALAVRSLPLPDAAIEFTRLLPALNRPLTKEELSLLGSHLDLPAVRQTFTDLLESADKQETTLQTMKDLDPRVAAIPELAGAVADACLDLLSAKRCDSTERLVIHLARRFRLFSLSGEVAAWTKTAGRSEDDLMIGLAALREIGTSDSDIFLTHLDHSGENVRREALVGFANMEDARVVPEIADRWHQLSGAHRSLAITGITASRQKAESFARALLSGGFSGYDETAVEKLISVLGAENPSVQELLKSTEGLLHPVLRLTEQDAGRIVTELAFKGPFTLEAWIKLDPGIDQRDSILGKKNGTDFNFAGGRLRVWGVDAGDIIIASRPMEPGIWTHCAIVRGADNRFTIYLDGEKDPANSLEFAADYSGMNIGENYTGGTSSASYDEIRLWNKERTEDEIRRDFNTSFSSTELPEGLVFLSSGKKVTGRLEGGARIALTRDAPELVTPEDARQQEEKFSRFRKMAVASGNAARGKELFQASCMICHQVNGEGVFIGPDLSGAGAMGVESLLRNILTPNAQLEHAYYRHDLKLTDQSVVSGFLAHNSETSITIRQVGSDDRIISKSDIQSHEISRRSLMPEGLMDGFSEQQVSDLFTYLNSLR